MKFTNAEKRSTELINTINAFLGKGSMTTLEAQKLRGTHAIHGRSVVWPIGQIMYERGHKSRV